MIRDNGNAGGGLKRAIRDVRVALAERGDAVVEMREAEHARLALVAEALQGVFDDLPEDQEQFSLRVLPGDPPRFWVDATSFVMMARDKRTYQFAKDTRLGRTLLAESTGHEAIADAVTRYVAERLVEREQAMEADWVTAMMRTKRIGRPRRMLALWESRGIFWGLVGFVLGMIAGMFLLLAYAWVMVD
jgi:hypothetical protein